MNPPPPSTRLRTSAPTAPASIETPPVQLVRSERMQNLVDRRDRLGREGRRSNFVDNAEFLVYHWSGVGEGFAPPTGEQAVTGRINVGDNNCRVFLGTPFPHTDEMPSRIDGHVDEILNWARDYAFFLDHNPCEIHPEEEVVGEFHWQLDEARCFRYPDEVREAGFQSWELGAGGISYAHTCPDLSIGLELGWGGLLKKIRHWNARHEANGNEPAARNLSAQELVVESIQRWVKRHAETAEALASNAPESLARHYHRVAQTCHAIVSDPPRTFLQGIQWIQFFQLAERIIAHGNGYGRLDQLLADLYRRDLAAGRMTREEARGWVAELFCKYGGNYFSVGGRNREGRDATNELSWVIMEAYDLNGGDNNLGVMWHADMALAFFTYACDVLGRHGTGTPVLINYDVLRDSELRSGVSEEHAWNVAYSGCQWYCVVGREYNDQDLNSLVLIQPMQRAIRRAVKAGVNDFDDLFRLFSRETFATAKALRDFKNSTYMWQSRVWPEMVTSLCMHNCIERGRDCTDAGAVDYNLTSANVLGVPNVSDSFHAIKTLVFDQRRYSLAEVEQAVLCDWKGKEAMRQEFLNIEKFGNDLAAPDAMMVKVAEMVRTHLESLRHNKGGHFRASLFQYMGHTYAGPMLGATPDGRHAAEPLAHGMNPMHGRNTKGLTATANSFCKVDFRKFQGGSFQIELEPSYFPEDADRSALVETFARTFFKLGGVQINLNIISMEKLKQAMEQPELPEHQAIVVKVTGYSSHFLIMDQKFQEEFLQRVNYPAL
ncbi:MAG: pyruvate formate lyase family protein [Verrucomicrobiota bacterium]